MTERPAGMDYGPIPESKIWEHAERWFITDPDDVDDFVTLIRALEATYRECTKPKPEPEDNDEEPPASPQGTVNGRSPRNHH